MKYCVPGLLLVLLFHSLSPQKRNPLSPTLKVPAQAKPPAQAPQSREDSVRLLEQRLEQLERVAEAQKALREELEGTLRAELKSKPESLREDVSDRWKKEQKTIAETNEALNKLVPPLGAVLPYFGEPAKIPDGYVLADGKTRWPSENWVPAHLRGQSVPNMGGMLLGGAAQKAEIRHGWTSGLWDGVSFDGAKYPELQNALTMSGTTANNTGHGSETRLKNRAVHFISKLK